MIRHDAKLHYVRQYQIGCDEEGRKKSSQVRSVQVKSDQVRSVQVKSRQVRSVQVKSRQVK